MASEPDIQNEKQTEKSQHDSESTSRPTTTEQDPGASEKAEDEDHGGYLVRMGQGQGAETIKLTSAQRIFTFAGESEYTLQGIAIFAAIASGAGIALQNLIFGAFITVIVDFTTGKSDPDGFLDEAGKLA